MTVRKLSNLVLTIHVNHVSSVSQTICKKLGLNTELACAIANGHDLGHAPFGHQGEKILKNIVQSYTSEPFWHEKNSLWFIDKLETLSGPDGKEHNLNLTYAVRDGIVSHCGEVDENAIFPRSEYISLEELLKPSQYQPFTWEGCVVKISDKISYLGRDIEDALALGILSVSQIKDLKEILKTSIGEDIKLREINNTVLMHNFIIDLCSNSNPDEGIRFSKKYLELINAIKKFNYDNIYLHPRLDPFKNYAELIITSIYNLLLDQYRGVNTLQALSKLNKTYPLTVTYFSNWLVKYSSISLDERNRMKLSNDVVYNIEDEQDYKRAIVDYISGMTDGFAIRAFMEITSF